MGDVISSILVLRRRAWPWGFVIITTIAGTRDCHHADAG
jgi:hypothetical protein